jgi:hypothetical protein
MILRGIDLLDCFKGSLFRPRKVDKLNGAFYKLVIPEIHIMALLDAMACPIPINLVLTPGLDAVIPQLIQNRHSM